MFRSADPGPSRTTIGGMTFSRFVAIGDSQTEGMCDDDGAGGLRGWADRLAERLADLRPDVRYANLAVRGKNTRDTLVEQLEPALALHPDLIAAPLGMNDVIGRTDLDRVHADLSTIYERLAATGATVIVSTFPDISAINPLGRFFGERLLELNRFMRDFAREHGFVLVDLYAAPVLVDPRAWSPDRLHASPLGHERFAAGAAHALGLPDGDPEWGAPLPGRDTPHPVAQAAADLRWAAEFFTPWMIRRLRGRSLGDGREPKRPVPSPVRAPADRPAVGSEGA